MQHVTAIPLTTCLVKQTHLKTLQAQLSPSKSKSVYKDTLYLMHTPCTMHQHIDDLSLCRCANQA